MRFWKLKRKQSNGQKTKPSPSAKAEPPNSAPRKYILTRPGLVADNPMRLAGRSLRRFNRGTTGGRASEYSRLTAPPPRFREVFLLSVKITTWVFEHSKASGGDLLVLLILADHADDESWECWPSIERIAALARMSERGIRYCLKNLETLGEVIVKRPYRTQGNIYRITLDSNHVVPVKSGRRPSEDPVSYDRQSLPVDDRQSLPLTVDSDRQSLPVGPEAHFRSDRKPTSGRLKEEPSLNLQDPPNPPGKRGGSSPRTETNLLEAAALELFRNGETVKTVCGSLGIRKRRAAELALLVQRNAKAPDPPQNGSVSDWRSVKQAEEARRFDERRRQGFVG
jgi:hypothetical protein